MGAPRVELARPSRLHKRKTADAARLSVITVWRTRSCCGLRRSPAVLTGWNATMAADTGRYLRLRIQQMYLGYGEGERDPAARRLPQCVMTSQNGSAHT
jgi:hypothetical protein